MPLQGSPSKYAVPGLKEQDASMSQSLLTMAVAVKIRKEIL